MKMLKDRYRQFKEWKQQPPKVAPLSEEQHECTTCGTHYQGNYCPRCGQSARIGRYSFKNAFFLFLDVWGLGNRSMFRSIRDLLLRPGYMIRDYLRGMQMAYFPPFKMYFLLTALMLLMDSGMNIQGINRLEQQERETEELLEGFKIGAKQADANEKEASEMTDKTASKEDKAKLVDEEVNQKTDIIEDWLIQHISAVMLIGLLLFSCPLGLLFRHSPAIPDIRLSESFVAMVYISNMYFIYNLVPSLLCFSLIADAIYALLTLLLVIIPIKQLSGYSYWSTIWRVALAAILLIIGFLLMCFVVGIVIAIFSMI